MKLTYRTVAPLLAAALAMPTGAMARHYDYYDHHHRNDSGKSAAVGAAIGLAIVGIAAAAAASKRNKERERERYYNDRNWGRTYEPASEIICYSDEQRCYWRGHYSFEWTQREFGYDPSRRGY